MSVNDVALDSAGNLYVSDVDNSRVRKVDPAGVITTVAGNGTFGFSGDGGLATEAALAIPSGITIDSTGSLYIADSGPGVHRVRKVDPNGTITTVAGNGKGEYGVGEFSGDGGPATDASLADPADVEVDNAGNVYIADSGNDRIRKVDTHGVITTVAGGGPGVQGDGLPATLADLEWPLGVAVDRQGSIFIADTFRSQIRKVNPFGIITTVAGRGYGDGGDGGLAILALLQFPPGVLPDDSGGFYIADDFRVRFVDPDGFIRTVAGTGERGFSGDGGPATAATLYAGGLALSPHGDLYISDNTNKRVRKVDPAGVITTVAGSGYVRYCCDGGPARDAALNSPQAVAAAADGSVYIADDVNNRVRKVSPSGIITTFAGTGVEGFSGDGAPAAEARLARPRGVVVDGDGNVYISDMENQRIRKVSTDGVITTIAGTGVNGFVGDGGPADQANLNYPRGLALDGAGNLYIADQFNHRVRKVDVDGRISTVAGNGECCFSGDGGPATEARLNDPRDVALDDAGNLYVASSARVRLVDAGGVISTVAGNGSGEHSGDGGLATEAGLNPRSLDVDATGRLFIADSRNSRVRMVGSDGIISTVAGTGDEGFSGDGGPAIEATLTPWGLALIDGSRLVVADLPNHRIRLVQGL